MAATKGMLNLRINCWLHQILITTQKTMLPGVIELCTRLLYHIAFTYLLERANGRICHLCQPGYRRSKLPS